MGQIDLIKALLKSFKDMLRQLYYTNLASFSKKGMAVVTGLQKLNPTIDKI